MDGKYSVHSVLESSCDASVWEAWSCVQRRKEVTDPDLHHPLTLPAHCPLHTGEETILPYKIWEHAAARSSCKLVCALQ